jgi:aconitate hydratase
VVAYALAGRVDIDFETEAIADGVFLRDIWPSNDEVRNLMESSLGSEQFREAYRDVFDSNETWNAIEVPEGQLFEWDEDSSYIREPSFFLHLQPEPSSIEAVQSARCLLMLGDSVTTDHISPAGVIAKDSPAATYLRDMGVEDRDFNSYGSRRGNHEVMMRGTFANIRIRNEILDGVEGGYSLHIPSGEQMSVWEVAERYREEKTPLVVLAGKQYGTGSSRDWAAKGTSLQGIRAVIAESFERIHRSNLAGFGVLPLQFQEGDSHRSLGLTGRELFDIEGLHDSLKPGEKLRVSARSEDGSEKQFEVVLRLDTPVEIDYYRHGGILHSVLRRMASD